MPNAILDPTGGAGAVGAALAGAAVDRAAGGGSAALHGAPGYRYATTPHPVAVLTSGQVRERAAAVLPAVVNLLGDPAGGSTPE